MLDGVIESERLQAAFQHPQFVDDPTIRHR
jgi:hypothetical protein